MNVFQAAAESGVRKIVYASSIQAMAGSRWGQNDTQPGVPYLPLDGETPQHPGNHYALSKCTGEMQLGYLPSRRRSPSTTRSGFRF